MNIPTTISLTAITDLEELRELGEREPVIAVAVVPIAGAAKRDLLYDHLSPADARALANQLRRQADYCEAHVGASGGFQVVASQRPDNDV